MAAPELRRGLYTTAQELPGSGDVNENPENMPGSSSAGYKNTQAHSQATSQPTTPSPVPLTYMSAEPVYGTQARAAGTIDEGNLVGLAVVIVGAVICCVLGYNIYYIKKKKKEAKTNKFADAQLIAHLMLELDRARASKLDSETALKIAAEKKDQEIQTQLAEMRSQIEVMLGKVQERDAEADISRRQKREAEEALIIEREKAIQLGRQATTNALLEVKIPESGRGDDRDGELSHCLTGPSTWSPDTATTQVVNGEYSPMATTTPGELNIPNRKRHEHWYNYWQARNMTIVYSNDDVIEMELPCFDAKFKNIGIALPAENHEDRMSEDGKKLEHTNCTHCLQWYTKKDMYDHLKTCKAFWSLAIRCGHCKGIFKYNNAFFDLHVPERQAKFGEVDGSEKHYTLANLGFGVQG